MNEVPKRRALAWLLTCLLATVATASMPTAAAHNCKSYDESECDPNGCIEGQAHYHKHLRHWWEGDDEYCQTEGKKEEKEDPPAKEKCIIADKEFPRGVCDLINESRAFVLPVIDFLPGLGSRPLPPLPETPATPGEPEQPTVELK